MPLDTDTLTDLYDARIGGEPPGLPAPLSPCLEDACQGFVPQPASVQGPATVAPDGGGNVVPRSLARVAFVRIAPTGRGMRVTVRVTRAGRVAISATTRLGAASGSSRAAIKRARGARTPEARRRARIEGSKGASAQAATEGDGHGAAVDGCAPGSAKRSRCGPGRGDEPVVVALPGRLALACLLCAVSASSAGAALGVVPAGLPQGFEVTTSTAQAGAPTDFVTDFTLTLRLAHPLAGTQHPRRGRTAGILRDVVVDLPVGLNGNGGAVPQCAELIDVSLLSDQQPGRSRRRQGA